MSVFRVSLFIFWRKAILSPFHTQTVYFREGLDSSKTDIFIEMHV